MIQPKEKYSRNIQKDGKDYEIVISVYDQPVRQNSEVSLYTRVAINHENSEWGHFYLPQPIPKDGVQGVVEAVKSNLHLYRFQS